MDCGPTCLRMVAQFYGKHFSLETLRKNSSISREGVSLSGISKAADDIGLDSHGTKITFDQLISITPLPCILHWNQNHFIVLPPQKFKAKKDRIIIADPARGLISITKETFYKSWITSDESTGVALLLEPKPSFFELKEDSHTNTSFKFMYEYLKPYKKLVFQLLFGMLLGSLFSLIFPFLTQALVDYGINLQNLNLIYLILAAQLTLFVGNTTIEIIRGWILLHIGVRVNMSIVSDFLVKLMKLPISYFDTKMVGDINQRISDNTKIEQFLSVTSLNTIFSLVNLIVFAVVLGTYGLSIFLTFLLGSATSIIWILFFLNKRRELDYERFNQLTENQNTLFEIITGIQEIKLHDSEDSHRWKWERIQSRLFKIRTKSLVTMQFQNIGSSFFNQLKNIIISFIAAKGVMEGHLTLGMMLSVSYIIGQTNSPIEQLLSFFQIAQDAKISVERLSEIYQQNNEEETGNLRPDHEINSHVDSIGLSPKKLSHNPNLTLKNVYFRYSGSETPWVLNDISLTIPFGKTTAIVGASGSGKTTLIKLLLKYYLPQKGEILIGNTSLTDTSAKWWWGNCGVVMSEGYVFSGTIEQNIAIKEPVNKQKLTSAIRIANIESFINQLPLGLSTKIGQSGNGISSGQKQRIMIARAVYKQPSFLFLDEATSTLDANNERIIIENLHNFTNGRTVIVIAHRLSTVRHADQIVVMEDGKIVEIGDHHTLTKNKGKYFKLVKNQLELGT